jgi:hypothetical protein
MLSGQFQGFITQTFAHFQDRILTLHTVHRCALCLGSSLDAETGHNHVETATQTKTTEPTTNDNYCKIKERAYSGTHSRRSTSRLQSQVL